MWPQPKNWSVIGNLPSLPFLLTSHFSKDHALISLQRPKPISKGAQNRELQRQQEQQTQTLTETPPLRNAARTAFSTASSVDAICELCVNVVSSIFYLRSVIICFPRDLPAYTPDPSFPMTISRMQISMYLRRRMKTDQ